MPYILAPSRRHELEQCLDRLHQLKYKLLQAGPVNMAIHPDLSRFITDSIKLIATIRLVLGGAETYDKAFDWVPCHFIVFSMTHMANRMLRDAPGWEPVETIIINLDLGHPTDVDQGFQTWLGEGA